MRKVLISLLLLLFVVQTNAQVKASADAAKALDKAKLEVQNPKKASNPASWVKLGTAYADCYDAPIKGIWQGASQMEAKMLLKDFNFLLHFRSNIPSGYCAFFHQYVVTPSKQRRYELRRASTRAVYSRGYFGGFDKRRSTTDLCLLQRCGTRKHI